MDEQDKSALYAAMYHDVDEPKRPGRVAEPSAGKTRKIRVGIVEYETPTPEYVVQLEHMLAAQARLIEEQGRAIRRLEHAMRGTRNFLRRKLNQGAPD